MIICLQPSNPMMGKILKNLDAWIEQIMTACKISGRNPKFVALAKSTGAVTEVNIEYETKGNLGRICRRTEKMFLR